MSSDFDTTILNHVAHRPWPLPNRPWVMTQTWNDLLFAHWPLDPSRLRPHVPSLFELDVYDAAGWLAIVPFHMTNVGPRGMPALPGVSAFPELNVRTYVRVADRPGVYFFSLDAASALAVTTARALLGLPYYTAAMSVMPDGAAIRYQSHRHGNPAADLAAVYEPIGPPATPTAGTLEYFLTERYCLYAVGPLGKPYRLEIHHRSWPLQSARAEFARNSMAAAAGIELPAQPPLLHFAKRQDVVVWAPTLLEVP